MSALNNLAKERSYHSEILQGKMIISVFSTEEFKITIFKAQLMKYLKILNKYNYIENKNREFSNH